MTRRQLVSLIAAIALGALASYFLQNTRSLGQFVGGSATATRIREDRGAPTAVVGDGSLTVVMFTDYQCPACRKADPALRRAVTRDGNVRLVYRDWPIFGEDSWRAARTALAAHRQGIYPSLHHELMEARSLDDVVVQAIVERIGGDWDRLQADMLIHDRDIQHQLTQNGQDAFALGLQGTPGYLIGPLLVRGALTESEFLRAFERARRQS